MLGWIKSLFKNPKALIKIGVDALDFAVPLLADELEKVREKFLKMSSTQQAQFAVDWVQDYLRGVFKLEAEPMTDEKSESLEAVREAVKKDA